MPAGLLCRLCQFFFIFFFWGGGVLLREFFCKDFAFSQIPEYRKLSSDVFHRALHCVTPTDSVRSVAAGNDYDLLSTPM